MIRRDLLICLLYTFLSSINAQFQLPLLQRPNQLQMLLRRPRWPIVQQPIAFKPMPLHVKSPSIVPYRNQQPFAMLPANQNLIWKQPQLGYRPNHIKDIFHKPSQNHNNIFPASSIPQSFITSNQSPIQQQPLVGRIAPVNLLSPSYTKLYAHQKPYRVQTAQTISTTPATTAIPTKPPPTHKPQNFNYKPTNIKPSAPTSHVHQVQFAQQAFSYPVPQALPLTSNNNYGFERSPIHTIPAPNLSLSDKPIIVPDQPNDIDIQQSISYVPKGTHTYEVTEDVKDHPKENIFLPSQPAIQIKNKLNPIASNTQTVAYQAQAHVPLSSDELLKLLNSAPQQQLSDTYSIPLVKQPQLQKYISQNTYRSSNPILQALNTVTSQPTSSISLKPNMAFNQEQRYAAQAPTQYSHQFNFQPNYQTFNYEEPQNLLTAQSVSQPQVQKPDDSSKQHSNVVRSTQEGTLSANSDKFNATGSVENTLTVSSTQDSQFTPIEPKLYYNKDLFKDLDDLIVSSTQNKEYFSSLSSNDMADTLAALQAAGHMMNAAKITNPGVKPVVNLNPYTMKNSVSRSEKSTILISPPVVGYQHYQAPSTRVYIPDQYDFQEQPTKNIEVKASINAKDISNESDDYGDYYYRYLETFENNTATEPSQIYVTPLQEEMNRNDVVVSVNRNNSAPTLDILTKDWRTSIAINTKSEDESKTRTKRD